MARPRLKRGDLITAVFAGDYGKPRPTVVVQADRLGNLESVLLCPLTSRVDTHGPARVLIPATPMNQLKSNSLVMVDKITAVSLSRCRERLGALHNDELQQVDEVLLLVLGLVD